MTPLATGRTSRLSAQFQPEVTDDQSGASIGASSGPVGLLLLTAWFGLASGLLELGMLFARKWWKGAGSLGALQLNPHFVGLVPVANLILFAACGLPLALLALSRRRFVPRLAAFVLCAIALLNVLLAIRGLHALAYVLLALGIACRVSRWTDLRRERFRRFVLRSLPVLALVAAVLVVTDLGRDGFSERRALAALPKAPAGAPNVLLIVLDTVRADHLSLYGYHRATSPHLAKLARRGVRFAHARAPAPWTLPSHASMFTGRWPHELSARDDRPLDASEPTLAEFLAARGYATAGFVANTFFCNPWYGLGRGFHHYEGDDRSLVATLRTSGLGRRIVRATVSARNARPDAYFDRKDAARINRDFLRWLPSRGDRPFFAFLNYYDAHDPYVPPDSAPRRFGLRPQGPADDELLRTWSVAGKLEPTPRNVALGRDSYDNCIAYLDEQLGQLFEELDRRGLLRNTVVIVTADHGEHFGEHGLFGHGNSLYGPEVHVPLLIVAPAGVPVDRVIPEPVSLRDLPATLADLLGFADQSPFPGRSLARLWEPSHPSAAESAVPVLSVLTAHGEARKKPKRRSHDLPPPTRDLPLSQSTVSLVADGKSYIRHADGREELYDLQNDPREEQNLAGTAEGLPRLEPFRRALDRLDRDYPPYRERE
ncbi:MAG: sulfatase-like hydrolase/transferase [Isosphaeraceae bacterium]|nr:sulfatase-like hydrolase/transferase [Isosphaeraceae bacterium]